MEKGYADVNRELLRVFNIYALHLTSNVYIYLLIYIELGTYLVYW